MLCSFLRAWAAHEELSFIPACATALLGDCRSDCVVGNASSPSLLVWGWIGSGERS